MSFGTIWSYPNNPRVMKIQAAASFNNLTLTTADFTMGTTNREPAFLAKFPMAKVPAFEGADGLTLTESDAIAQYVADSGPAADQLLGSSAVERAAVRQWVCFADGEVQCPVIQLILPRVGYKAFVESVEKSALGQLERALDYLEGHLRGREWVATEKLSLADISVAAALYWGFSMVIDQEMRQKYPFVVSWYEKTLESEGVKQTFGEKKFIEKRETPKA
ncbi:glutathione S-transferase family protein [Aspergillus clavatus NRRL 1]|uniref:Translation elongation factor eEF-1B gamma subunit, putative n=1 Tax=Aspergillus clavatus (strain ATCC 1007 / CBS 513.65 / DSM 816 / NCTC 3887 / NRRL 1 / QM 1276 / 107) TaxID=344612 RepID=A1CNB4_ASPCL|nr:translation elongation factor eEF-1B gamma subunit, putative [Aspergillus clavatus NRRL 1]EAW07135.1 translation elongation factor eEF-1B gamma subunit, putative [Aspergillus clavatus NRRL 1]